MIKIYRIVDNTNGNIYIGKTKKKYLCQRLAQHKYDYKNNEKTCMSRDIIKNGDYKIELIEETDDDTRERYWVENSECINKHIPGRTRQEYREKNKESKSRTDKEYYKNNKEKIKYNTKHRRQYKSSWGGDPRSNNNNNLLKIDPNLFF